MYRVAITGSSIYARRKDLGLTIRQLARKSGVPRSTISRYERGESLPTPARLHRIADALQSTVLDLEFGA